MKCNYSKIITCLIGTVTKKKLRVTETKSCGKQWSARSRKDKVW